MTLMRFHPTAWRLLVGPALAISVACTSTGTDGGCPTVRNGCSIRCMPTNPPTLAKMEAAYADASSDAGCPTGYAYAERREACGRVEYYEFAGPPAASYFDEKTGELLGVDNSVEGSCAYAGQVGFGCSEPEKCTFLCGTGKGRAAQPHCEPNRDAGADAADAGALDGGSE